MIDRDVFVGLVSGAVGLGLVYGSWQNNSRLMQGLLVQWMAFAWGEVLARIAVACVGGLFVAMGIWLILTGTNRPERPGLSSQGLPSLNRTSFFSSRM